MCAVKPPDKALGASVLVYQDRFFVVHYDWQKGLVLKRNIFSVFRGAHIILRRQLLFRWFALIELMDG